MNILFRKLGKVIRMAACHIAGQCPVCGRLTVFLCVDAVCNARNHLVCIFCHSYARKRHVAKIINERFALDRSLRNLKNTTVSMYNTESKGVFSSFLGDYSGYYASDYLPGIPLGTELAPRVSVQDLEKLTFPDRMFDVVVTEDVLEHVRNDAQAFKEIYRVLKPGGVHIFTVPFLFDRSTLCRVDVSTGKEIFLLPPEFHGDPIRGEILTYRTYGMDMYDILRDIGFSVRVVFSSYADMRNGIVDSFVFIAEKQ